MKWWHPGFWRFVYRTLREKAGCGVLEAAKLTAKCVWQFVRK